jgi:hypothetical protein
LLLLEPDHKVWKWLQEHNLTGIQYRDLGGYGAGMRNYYLGDAFGYFLQRVDEIAIAHGRTPVHW